MKKNNNVNNTDDTIYICENCSSLSKDEKNGLLIFISILYVSLIGGFFYLNGI